MFKFRYYISGANIGALVIAVEDREFTRSREWNLAGDQGDLWQLGMLPVNHTSGQFRVCVHFHLRGLYILQSWSLNIQIIVDAVLGIGDVGTIAIDDTQLVMESCDGMRMFGVFCLEM